MSGDQLGQQSQLVLNAEFEATSLSREFLLSRVQKPWWLNSELDADSWQWSGEKHGDHSASLVVNWKELLSSVDVPNWSLNGWLDYARALSYHYRESDETRCSRSSSQITFSRNLCVVASFFMKRKCYSVSYISKGDVDAYLDYLKDKRYSESYISQLLTVLLMMWRLAPEVGKGLAIEPFDANQLMSIAKNVGVQGGHYTTLRPKVVLRMLNFAVSKIQSCSDLLNDFDYYMTRCAAIGRMDSKKFLRDKGYKSSVLQNEIKLLYASSLVTILGLTAWRKHQVANMERDQDFDPLKEINYLKGRFYKTAGTVTGESTSISVIEEVVVAFNVIERLTAYTIRCDRSKDAPLLKLPFGHSCRSDLTAQYELVTGDINRLLDRFAKAVGYEDSTLRSHMFRRGFSLLWAWQFEVGDLESLSLILNHQSHVFTKEYIDDPDYFDFLPDEHKAITTHILERALNGEIHHEGSLESILDKYRRKLTGASKVVAPKKVANMAEKIMETLDLTVVSHSDGYCFISERSKSACNDGRKEPDMISRTSSLCLECNNFGIDRGRVAHWEERIKQHQIVADTTKRDKLRLASLDYIALAKMAVDKLKVTGSVDIVKIQER